jgi:hypothetical protein
VWADHSVSLLPSMSHLQTPFQPQNAVLVWTAEYQTLRSQGLSRQSAQHQPDTGRCLSQSLSTKRRHPQDPAYTKYVQHVMQFSALPEYGNPLLSHDQPPRWRGFRSHPTNFTWIHPAHHVDITCQDLSGERAMHLSVLSLYALIQREYSRAPHTS